MNIKQFTLKDLREEVKSNDLWNTKTIPITRQRLISFLYNPRAKEDDIVLLIGYNKEDVVGYVAIVPDLIYPGGEEHRLGWLGAMWSNPDPKNSMMAGMLLLNAYKAFNQSVADSVAADEALKLFKASRKFIPLKLANGYQYILKSNLYFWIPRKISFTKNFLFILRFADWGVNLFQNMRLNIWKRRNNLYKNYNLEYFSQIFEQDAIDFIDKNNKRDLTRKTANDLNYILKYHSAIASPLKDHIKSRYYFSSKGFRYDFFGVKVTDKNTGEIKAIVIYHIEGQHLMASFAFYAPEDVTLVAKLTIHHVLAMNAEMITTYNPDLIKAINEVNTPYIYKKKRVRESLIAKTFQDKKFDDLFMHDGDGA